jgi:hypothetical protein
VKKFLTLAAAFAVAAQADAGVFHRKANCTVATCQPQATAKAAGDTSTAQGVAVLIVTSGRFRHFGGYNGYEGIGMGATQAQAEANCCYRGRLLPRERGFAQMANGLWVCVCRY